VIEQGNNKQLVYYWFKQRNRNITNEYAVKWFIFWDALTRRRTDGALVRLITPVFNGEELAVADSRLASFASLMVPILPAYVPD
jgi:EpsI family protein